MRKLTSIVVCVLMILAVVSCGGSPSWNQQEEQIYNEFLALQGEAQVKMDYLLENSPENFQDAKSTAQFIWDWKGYEDSGISSIYKSWRTSAGYAIEGRGILYFYLDDVPNYQREKAEAEMNEQLWLQHAKDVVDAVEILKNGVNPLTK